jgi:holin (3TMs family)
MPAPLIIAGIIEAVKTVIDRQIPDKNIAAQAKAALDSSESVQQFQIALAQIGVNLEEVKSGHWLGKWRGALGWGAVAAMLYQLMVYPMIVGTILIFDPAFPVEKLPVLEWKQLGTILMGMLGLGV